MSKNSIIFHLFLFLYFLLQISNQTDYQEFTFDENLNYLEFSNETDFIYLKGNFQKEKYSYISLQLENVNKKSLNRILVKILHENEKDNFPVYKTADYIIQDRNSILYIPINDLDISTSDNFKALISIPCTNNLCNGKILFQISYVIEIEDNKIFEVELNPYSTIKINYMNTENNQFISFLGGSIINFNVSYNKDLSDTIYFKQNFVNGYGIYTEENFGNNSETIHFKIESFSDSIEYIRISNRKISTFSNPINIYDFDIIDFISYNRSVPEYIFIH